MSALIESVIYSTACTPEGVVLIGGVWTLRAQEGFPLEMAHMVCQTNGWRVDWLEAMADASRTDECPALMRQVEAFLDAGTILALKLGFVRVHREGATWEQVVERKRANGRAFGAFVAACVVKARGLDDEDEQEDGTEGLVTCA